MALLASARPLVDNSFLTHLATGRIIWAGDGFPRTDPYSFTAAGLDWFPQSWFASVVFGAIDEVAGLGGLRVFFALAGGALVYGCWSLTRPAGDPVRRLLAIVPVAVMAAFGWTHRPYLFGFACLVAALHVAEGRLDHRWLLVAGWVWLNTHGSWPLGMVALAALWLGTRLDGGDGALERRALTWFAGGLALGCVNPYGPRLLAFPVSAFERRDVFASIKEWQAPLFRDTEELAFVGVLVLAVVALRLRPTWRFAVPAAVFVSAGLYSVRNLDMAAIVVLPGIAGALGHVVRPPLRVPWRPIAVLAAALAVVGLASIRSGDHFADDPYPVAATAWLEDHQLSPTEARVIARDFVGNYFEARYGTAARVFIDDRYELVPEEVVDDARTLLQGGEGWQEALERYDPDAVLWERDEPLGQLLEASDGWRVQHRDEAWLVAVPER